MKLKEQKKHKQKLSTKKLREMKNSKDKQRIKNTQKYIQKNSNKVVKVRVLERRNVRNTCDEHNEIDYHDYKDKY